MLVAQNLMVLTFMSRILMTLVFMSPVLMCVDLTPYSWTWLVRLRRRGKRLPGPMHKSLQHRTQVEQTQV